MSLEELVSNFDYHHISKSPAVFDTVKLKWMNGEYMKKMDPKAFYEKALPYIDEVVTRDCNKEKIASLVQTRIEIFPDIKDQIDFFQEVPEYDVEMYTHKKMKTNPENSLDILKKMKAKLETFDDWSEEGLHDYVINYIAELEIKNGMGLWPLRTAVSGKAMTPGGAFEIMYILGREESLRRIDIGIEKLEANQ
jgi:glutamyl-tRNA synthetase